MCVCTHRCIYGRSFASVSFCVLRHLPQKLYMPPGSAPQPFRPQRSPLTIINVSSRRSPRDVCLLNSLRLGMLPGVFRFSCDIMAIIFANLPDLWMYVWLVMWHSHYRSMVWCFCMCNGSKGKFTMENIIHLIVVFLWKFICAVFRMVSDLERMIFFTLNIWVSND